MGPRELFASGALPPVFDGAELHADGCLLNNLPVDVMRPDCSGPIVAVDIDQSADISHLPVVPRRHLGMAAAATASQSIRTRPRVPHVGLLFHRALMWPALRTRAPRGVGGPLSEPPGAGL